MSEPVYLRAIDESDLERCHRWHNDRNLYDTLVSPFRFVSKKAEQIWIDRRTAFSSTEVNLAIYLTESDKHIGNIYLREIDWISRNAHLAVFIGESEERSKGFGKSAVRQMIAHAFTDLGLQKIYLNLLADNLAAHRLYDKCGFIVEGRLKNHVFKNGIWKDLIVMGICSGDCATLHDTEKS